MELDQDRRRLLARIIAAGRLDGVELSSDAGFRDFACAEGMLPLLDWVSGTRDGPLRTQAALQLARRARLSRVLDLLAAENVTAIVFKGAHLAYACYPDPALRPHVDIDLLIHPGDADAARGVFERSGHRLVPHVTGRFVMSQFHYADGSAGLGHAYDVHWQIANPPVFRDVLPFDDVRAHARPLEPYGPHGLGPSLPHALLIACIHRAAHHRASERLIWLADLRQMLRAASPAEIDQFCRLADSSRLSAVCYEACARATELFGDLRVPRHLRLRARDAAEPSRAYLDAASPFARAWLDLRALPAWRDRVTLVREHLFPPAGYMREAFGGYGPLPLRYATRIVRGLVDWTRRA